MTTTPHSSQALKLRVQWQRDPANPIIPPDPQLPMECGCAMNPWVVRRGDEWWIYYAGADKDGIRRICLATAPVSNIHALKRHGVVLDVGAPGAYDARWVVLPHVIEIEPGKWHLYYSSNCGQGKGLSSFIGLGLATSSDGINWKRHSDQPIIAPSGKAGDDDALGIAGGSVIKVKLPDGKTQWRYYYTGCPTIGDDVFLDQQKRICLAVSDDAIHWTKRGAIMLRNPQRDYENIAVAGPVVSQLPDGTFRMWYSAIGTRYGFYTICYAESDDGLTWRRGEKIDDNLQLTPTGDGWEKQMVEYPSVVQDGDKLRLFYCGNRYGDTGIGTAISV